LRHEHHAHESLGPTRRAWYTGLVQRISSRPAHARRFRFGGQAALITSATAVLLALSSVFAAAALNGSRSSPSSRRHALATVPAAAPLPPTSMATTTTVATTTTTAPPPPPADLTLAGCPPPPPPTGPPSTPWHPTVLVPDSALPAPSPAPPRRASLAPVSGKGMWIWEFAATDRGDPSAIVSAAQKAGLHQLWVRVADSKDGFYGADELAKLVPVAHRQGIDVIGWGFPYLYDPVGDANWTVQALDWSAGPDHLDGFSADLEEASEGVDMTAQRVQVYLSLVRHDRPAALVVATVYRPTDQQWLAYPYRAIAPYVDAFAAMVYWGCDQPVVAAQQALTRLGTLAPVHLIGQAYNMADEGGRTAAPSPAEIDAFLVAARQGGALGASFWSWQSIDNNEWSAMATYPW